MIRAAKRKIPSLSQFLDVPLARWKDRSCGTGALATVIGYWNGKVPDLKKLHRQAIAQGAYLKGIGWRHKELAAVAARYGLSGENFDWAPESEMVAWKKFLASLRRGPIIASIWKDFKPGSSGHLIVVSAIKNGHVLYREPASKTRRGIYRQVSVKKFRIGWKKRIIVIHPNPLA